MAGMQAPSVHEKFSFSDADVAFQSSDGVLFRLHRKNLEVMTGAFPGPEFHVEEPVLLPESSTSLEIVFQFVYLRRYPPSLEGVAFEVLMDVAEAAEKYQVFWAMRTCEDRLTEHLSEHGLEILLHAIKHDVSMLVNKAALSLSRSPLQEILRVLPSHCTIPWLDYQRAWQKVFAEAKNGVILRAAASPLLTCSDFYGGLCHICAMCLHSWIERLEEISNLSALQDAMKTPVLYLKSCNEFVWCKSCRVNNCVHHVEDFALGNSTDAGLSQNDRASEERFSAMDHSETTSPQPRLNPFLRFAFEGSPRKSNIDKSSKTPPSPSSKSKETLLIRTIQVEEKCERKAKRRRVEGETDATSSTRSSGPNKVKFYDHLNEIEDHLDIGLDIVFCGINPGVQSAKIGHHYGNPNNHFWSCLHESGLTSRRWDPREDATLPKSCSLGLTNLTSRPTAEQNELSKKEQAAGVVALLDKVARYQPRILCFVGLGIADIFRSQLPSIDASSEIKAAQELKVKAAVGLQPYKIVYPDSTGKLNETVLFAVSSTSGRVVRYQKADKVRQFQTLRDLRDRIIQGDFDTTSLATVQFTRVDPQRLDSCNADVTIQSSDGVLFRLHRRNLECNTGAFPGPEISTQNEVVILTEPAKVLEVIFQYIYPRRYPFTLDHLGPDFLLEVAEAIEKYQIFWAMKPCEDQLQASIPQHALKVLTHAVKHDISRIMEKAAQALVLSPPSDVLKKLPVQLIISFVQYQGQWRDWVFGSAIRHIESQVYCDGDSYCNDVSSSSPDICRVCRVCLLAWVATLEKHVDLPSLCASLKSPILNTKNPEDDCRWCRNCRGNYCQNVPALVRVIEKAIKTAPPFNGSINTFSGSSNMETLEQ
ncbi:hypothetical protein CVT26_003028 [Gymnopilus dilepis]|uniref:BTB domain-containing protein n=1 Tax=Gymnopilus dilepis TaxID=231916 RepID=A0A409W2R8_9AGAR|nr:hypothetical protein CVT26_003028 [Gymnopilus dilepis]